MVAAKYSRSGLVPYGVDVQGLVMKDVEEWLEEQRHNLFTCFRCGRFGKADEFIVLAREP